MNVLTMTVFIQREFFQDILFDTHVVYRIMVAYSNESLIFSDLEFI